MSLYLPINAGGSVAIAICPRCQQKIQYSDLQKDPNNQNYYCKECVDIYDPYRLPARLAEEIGLQHPRSDVKLG